MLLLLLLLLLFAQELLNLQLLFLQLQTGSLHLQDLLLQQQLLVRVRSCIKCWLAPRTFNTAPARHCVVPTQRAAGHH